MPDMLVKLYDLPDTSASSDRGFEVRRALVPEKSIVTAWVRKNFSDGWADECEAAFFNKPVSCFLALRNGEILGFACHDATCRGFFGPMGVSENKRMGGVGKALLMKCLHAMRESGYAYAVIGWAGPVDFFKRCVSAVEIENSEPGFYKGILKKEGKCPPA